MADNVDALHGIESDVTFDFAAADSLISACNLAATAIDNQTGSRAGWVTAAKDEFKGYFAGLFADNMQAQADDAVLVAQRLRETASATGDLKASAQAENARRKKAREWKEKHDHRSIWDKGHDWLFGEDKPPVGPPDPAPHKPIATPTAKPRTTPTPGQGGGGGGGTSSAKPANLHSFATSSKGANDDLRPKPGDIQAKYTDFQSKCAWGSLDAQGVIDGFKTYIEHNDNDVRWATVVGDAFAKAGGEGTVSSLPDAALLNTLKANGVTAAREDLKVDMPQAIGHPPTTGYSLDPVNTATGNFLEDEVELPFEGGCATLAIRRTYNSFDEERHAFGVGWSSWAEAGLVLEADRARWVREDGRQTYFPRSGDGWDRAEHESYWLAEQGDSLVVSGTGPERWQFAPSGRLERVDVGEGTGLTFHHEQDRLARVVHDHGREISFEWAAGVIVAAVASDGRRMTYDYDEQGNLVSAAGPAGTRRYEVDGGLITKVIDADGVVEAENTYDGERRVAAQRSQFGRTAHLTYLPGRTTVIADPDGSRSNAWVSDEYGRQVGIVDTDGFRQSTSYDRWGNQVMVTTRGGEQTLSEYDDRGRPLTRLLPSGTKIRWQHDALDRPTRVEVVGDADTVAVTELAYAGSSRNPVAITDAEGGVTEFAWRGCLLERVTDPTGVWLAFGYDQFGDLTSVKNAEGGVVSLARDRAGRAVKLTTPKGEVTLCGYDDAGRLIRRVDPDGGAWAFEYTAAGRLAAVVDPLGGRTAFEHGDHGAETAQTDPLGHALRKLYDDLGNVASVVQPGGAAWSLDHDAMSRLIAVTDPTGAAWRQEFDVNGQVAAVTDPTGVTERCVVDADKRGATFTDGVATSGYRLDRFGRICSETDETGATRITRFDLCGRPVEYVDARGNVTEVERDAAGRVTGLTLPGGAHWTYSYDTCGRLSLVIDPMGGVARFGYDANSRPVSELDASGAESWLRYDACGRVVAAHEPGRGTTWCEYDLAGNVVAITDAYLGRRRFRYDAAGRLTEAVAGTGGVTRFERDADGRIVAVTDPLGNVSRRGYDEAGRLVSMADPLGRESSGAYDGAGRLVALQDAAGCRTQLEYGPGGYLDGVAVDGAPRCRVERDFGNRRLLLTEARPGGEARTGLAWDADGRLVELNRDGRAVRYTYDADGHRATMTTPDGARTDYARDLLGRVVGLAHPRLGEAAFRYDAAGRPVGVEAGGARYAWRYRDGHVVAAEGPAGTVAIGRDDEGRVVSLDGPTRERFGYDAAAQLVSHERDGAQTRYTYDAAGRLIAEEGPQGHRELRYDEASQLVAAIVGEAITRFGYDAAGRRTSADDGTRRVELSWGDNGRLAAILERGPAGERRTSLLVDTLGLLAKVNDAELFWDAAPDGPPSPVQVDGVDTLVAGGLLATPGGWTSTGWRAARSHGASPWQQGPTTAVGDVSLAAMGTVMLGAFEWLGARVYDAQTRGFLSTDPLDAVAGAGWAGNPYAYAGNDPLNLLDPTGLRPATDADLTAYQQAHGSHWEYIAGGAMVVAGVVMCATGFGGPAGAALVSMGADTLIQKGTTGNVNWTSVAINGGLSLVGGPLGRMGGTALGKVPGLGEGAAKYLGKALAGGVSGEAGYVGGNWGHLTPQGAMGSFAGGTLAGLSPSQLMDKLGPEAQTFDKVALRVGKAGADIPFNLVSDATNQEISTGHVDPTKMFLKVGAKTATSQLKDTGTDAWRRLVPTNPPPPINYANYGAE